MSDRAASDLPTGEGARAERRRDLGLIWAEARGGVIGADGELPWRLPEDLAQFRRITAKSAVIMGRRTWDSLPPRFRPLPGRRNIVVTRNPEWKADDPLAPEQPDVATSVIAALSLIGGDPAWVIGGGEIYRSAIDLADRLAVTEVDLEVSGDTFAPAIDDAWELEDQGDWLTSASGIRYRFMLYLPRSPQSESPL